MPANEQRLRCLPRTVKGLRRWYQKELQPQLSKMTASKIMQGAAMGRTYANYIIAGTQVPHPRHYPNLAALRQRHFPGRVLPRLWLERLKDP